MNTQSINNDNTGAGAVYFFNGVHVQVDDGYAEDYLCLRARQLVALARITTTEGFANWNGTVRSDVASLVSNLAEEVQQLIPLAMREAHKSD